MDAGGAAGDLLRHLIVAAGSTQSYFGNDSFAEIEPYPEAVAQWLTFVVVGAGPTGVEMAGQVSELAHHTLRRDYRRIDPAQARAIILDGAPAILGAFEERLAAKAAARLEQMGVEIRLGTAVVDVDADGIDVQDAIGDS